jgi:hypothetical protein
VVSRTYPEAEVLARICDDAVSVGVNLVGEAVAAGVARPGLTSADLFFLIWSTGAIIQAAPPSAGDMIDRHCDRLIDSIRHP